MAYCVRYVIGRNNRQEIRYEHCVAGERIYQGRARDCRGPGPYESDLRPKAQEPVISEEHYPPGQYRGISERRLAKYRKQHNNRTGRCTYISSINNSSGLRVESSYC